MSNLIINRVNYEITGIPSLYVSMNTGLIFKMSINSFDKYISNDFQNNQYQDWLNNGKEGDYIYYSFLKPNEFDGIVIEQSYFNFKYFAPKFVREQLVSFFRKQDFIVEPFPKGNDLTVFEKISNYNENWSVYRKYDFLIRSSRKEIVFNIGSDNTLISNEAQPIINGEKLKFINNINGLVEALGNRLDIDDSRIIANRERRTLLDISKKPVKLVYNTLYDQLVSFYNTYLLNINNDYIRIEAGGLKNVEPYDLNRVNLNENRMLFGKDKTDINAVTGLRDFGIFKPSPKAHDVKFIFVYENSTDANQLYLYLKNGLKHYPGLWSYVGIPITKLADREKNLQYNGVDDLKAKIDEFLETQFPENFYGNYFAFVIQPFSSQDKEDLEEAEPETYYLLKQKFLAKGISTQFIQDKNIHSGSFHYFLPNISIGILAKLGGIPWRLKTKKAEELIIGFNQKMIGGNRYIGSAVFFSNEGDLGRSCGFSEQSSENALIANLKVSIEQYIASAEKVPERLIIHYYKPQSNKEQKSIEHLIQNELRLNIPFAIIEINDSKSQIDICFDKDFSMGMPESGTYVKVSKCEYLLFNNTRYQKKPLRSVTEELPIKIAIHFADTGGFSHKDLISQVYEFSRLYWKGLKQRSQPATTIYSKLIADFAAHNDGFLPNNDTVNNTPWFL